MKQKAIIFDLDGTLIDSLTDIALCANEVLKEFNLPTHEIEDYKKFVGGGALFLMKNCSPNNTSEEEIYKLFEKFKEIYDSAIYSNTKPYNGVYELLDELTKQEFKIGILSNKPHEFTLKYVQKFFHKYNLQEIHGQKENIPKKPNPTGAINIANEFNISCEDTLFVGDSDVDMQTATNANMIAVGVEWGFRTVEELKENGANHIVRTPLEILHLLK